MSIYLSHFEVSLACLPGKFIIIIITIINALYYYITIIIIKMKLVILVSVNDSKRYNQ